MLFYYVAMVCLTGVSGMYHEQSVLKIKAPSTVRKSGLFGYSMAYQRLGEKLIVSAPNANGVGQLFQCHLASAACTEIHIPGTNKSAGFTDMWLGATVAAGSNFTIACAPRFTKLAQTNTSVSKNGTFGRCYTVPGYIGNVSELQSLEITDKEKGLAPFENYMDSFGWSANIDRHDSIIVGGPAMYTGRVIFYSNMDSHPKLVSQGQGSSIKFNFGYSVTSGQFMSENKDDISYAFSSPYGQYGYGTVVIKNDATTAGYTLRIPREYFPPVGSLFGGSLCSAKLRGLEQREVLLIGAPLYADKGDIDVGAVYVYQFHTAYNDIVHQRTILGTASRGRFGSAIINLGDLNGDNRDEIAISAPYEDSDHGAVYIYSAADILADKPADKVRYLQKIQPEGFSSLGFSMTAVQNYNDNNCNALAISAPENNTVLFYKCMTTFIVTVQKLKEHIDYGNSSRPRRNDTHFNFDLCVSIKYPAPRISVIVDIAIKLSLTHPTAWIVNSSEEGSIVYNISTHARSPTYCKLVNIVIPEEGNYEPFIQYQVSATQTNPPTNSARFEVTNALLSDLSILNRRDIVWIADCSSDKKCDPVLDFELNTSMKDGYVIGSSDTERLTVTVQNTGDPAYTACVRVNVTNVRVRLWPPRCKRVDANNGICSPNHPIRNNTSWNPGDIELETKSLRSNMKEVIFTVDLHKQCSPNIDNNPETKTKTIKLITDPKGLVTKGITNLGDIIYLSTVELEDTGKLFSHVYTVLNTGVTTWFNINCIIVLDKKSYFKGLRVTVDSETPYKCNKDVVEKNGQYLTNCTVLELKRSQTFDIILSIYIEPKTIDLNSLETENLSLTSYLKLSFENKQLDQSVTSILRKKEATVPLWVIIVATLVGIFIMLLIAFALYECGFLKRKNKEKLKELRRSVHRQSIRRSATERESRRLSRTAVDQKSDERKLIEESESSEPSSPSSVNCEPPPTKGEIPTKSLEKDMSSVEKLPKVMADGEKIKKELIVLGLQKNIGTRNPPPKPPKRNLQTEHKETSEEKETNKKK